jgi:hypothetical protein
MKRAAVMVVVVELAMLFGANSALAGSPPKATGDFSYHDYGVYRTVEFDVHAAYDNHLVKGMLHYSDENGFWYEVMVECAVVDSENGMAWFSGPVIDGNVGQGKWLFAKALDGGTPGRNGDQVWGNLYNVDPCPWVAAMADPADGPFDIVEGNLQVHP